MASIWAKIGGAVKTGRKIVAGELKYFFDPRNWGDSGDKIRHKAKQAFREALGRPTEEYTPSAEDVQTKSTLQASKDLGVQVRLVDYENGKMIFEASRTLAGDVFHLTDEQLSQIEELNKNSKYSKIAVDGEKGKIIIEVDVEEIINDINDDYRNKGKSPEEIKGLVIEAIKQKVDDDLKKLAGITDGEFKVHTDRKLLDAIGEALKPLEKSIQTPDPSETETLSSVTGQPSEAFRRIVQEVAEPLVNDGKRKMGSSDHDGRWQKRQKVESRGSKKENDVSI